MIFYTGMDKIPSISESGNLTEYFSNFSDSVRKNLSQMEFIEWLGNLGIHSRITFKHILKDRRKLNGLKFKNALDLSFKEAQSFDQLLFKKENENRENSQPMSYAVAHDFFASPLNTIVLNLCGINTKMNREEITAILRGAFSIDEINQSVDRLLKEKLIEENKERKLVRVFEGPLTTLPGIKSETCQRYFQLANKLSEVSWKLPLNIREQHSYTIRIDSKDIPRLKDLVRQFRSDCAALSEPQSRNSVYQCIVSAFPIFIDEK